MRLDWGAHTCLMLLFPVEAHCTATGEEAAVANDGNDSLYHYLQWWWLYSRRGVSQQQCLHIATHCRLECPYPSTLTGLAYQQLQRWACRNTGSRS